MANRGVGRWILLVFVLLLALLAYLAPSSDRGREVPSRYEPPPRAPGETEITLRLPAR